MFAAHPFGVVFAQPFAHLVATVAREPFTVRRIAKPSAWIAIIAPRRLTRETVETVRASRHRAVRVLTSTRDEAAGAAPSNDTPTGRVLVAVDYLREVAVALGQVDHFGGSLPKA